MKQLTSSEIRKMWLDFFESKGHKIEPSQSLIPVNDPTLLWINSGVATLKKYFDGSVVPENPRIVNSQKSIRTNDIENVGYTARHHTLFEMLGNFSIGDYFKKEVIPWAWELLTSPEWFAIEPEKLYITVYPDDEETYTMWRDVVGVPEDHLVKEKSNFWDIGEGPSGPDTEIFFDRGPEFQNLPDGDPELYPGGENERYLEIWNIVFSQFNHLPGLTDNKDYPELPHKNIDTGAGLERITSIFQNAKTNFETDLFLPIINKLEELSGVKYGQDDAKDVSFKVIADHTRAIVFAIGDGALPSNEGRGYIIRRLIRRSILHARKLGIEGDFLEQLVPVVSTIMKSYYPELVDQEASTSKVINAEEQRFSRTLNDGLVMFNQISESAKNNGGLISGEDAFKLYDTYGFPLELTQEQANEVGLKVDTDGFEEQMEAQRQRARGARSKDKSMGVQNALLVDLKVESKYVGWTDLEVKNAKVVTIIDGDDYDKTADANSTVQIILDQTPFYAEMGGQIADTGVLTNVSGQTVGKVINVTNAPNGQHIHTVEVLAPINIDDQLTASVDVERHVAISHNHTATHLLDQALRNVLGNDVHQAGSYVGVDNLRFDFSFQGPVAPEKLEEIEKQINEVIAKDLPISWVETDIESAKKLGAIAVFGEKYGEIVRVVSIGDFNVEFDGGTHATSTSQLGLFKITSESGIGAGVRRIEATTGLDALAIYKQQEKQLLDIAATLKSQGTDEIATKVQTLSDDLKNAQKEISNLNAKIASSSASDKLNKVQTAGKFTYVTAKIDVPGMDALHQIADTWKQNGEGDLLALASSDGSNKVNLLIASKNDQLKAGDIIKAIAKPINGGGGGRPDMAQAGGKNPAGIDESFKILGDYLTEI